jgi:hypothetical protein
MNRALLAALLVVGLSASAPAAKLDYRSLLDRTADMPDAKRTKIVYEVLSRSSRSGDIATVRYAFVSYPALTQQASWPAIQQDCIDQARANGHDDIVAVLQSAGTPPAAPAAPAEASVEKKAAPSFHSDVDQASEKATDRPDDFALVIGIEEYQGLPKADFGARDAQAVRKHLEALGIPARNIITLEGSAATGNKMKSYLEEWLPLNVKETSTLFVYYSGHGAPDPSNGQAYLVPWDGDPQFLKSTAYPLKKFYGDLAKTKAKHVIVALDACFSGAGGRSVLAKGARPLVTKVDQGLGPDGRITVLAAASGEQITGTLDDQGHGMFTYFFLKGLGEGKSSAKSLFDYVNPRVQDEARRQNRQQTPAFMGADSPL